MESPFHEGELHVQDRTGSLGLGARSSEAIADAILPGAIRFIAAQPMAVLASADAQGAVWCSTLFGPPGFVSAVDDRTVVFDLARTLMAPGDPFLRNISGDPRAGLLLIELATRRRIRINGTVVREGQDRIRLDVAESYPNCPRYIQRRSLAVHPGAARSSRPRPLAGSGLTPKQQQLISASDTFFVASAHPGRGFDASHRGGNRGFVRVLNEQTLRIPDYPGNGMFNTLGNFVVNPRAGLAFVDWDEASVLQLTGRVEIQWSLGDAGQTSAGTGRFWDVHIDACVESSLPAHLEAVFLDASPHNPPA